MLCTNLEILKLNFHEHYEQKIKHFAKKEVFVCFEASHLMPPNTLQLFFCIMFYNFFSIFMKNSYFIISRLFKQQRQRTEILVSNFGFI